jgi:hypothetical protein
LVGEELKNIYSGVAAGEGGKGPWPALYGLWSSKGVKNGFNPDFNKDYRNEFLKFIQENLVKRSADDVKQRNKMDDNIENRLKQAKAMEAYTKDMDRRIYQKANPAFQPININKNLQGANEAEQLKNLKTSINSEYFPFRGDNFNKPFPYGRYDLEGFEQSMDEFGIRGFDPEELRETVLTDSAALKAMSARKKYALTGKLTPKKMKSIAGQGNVLSGALNEQVGLADGGAFGVDEQTKLIDMFVNSLNFDAFMIDRNEKLKSFKQADLSKGVKGSVYEKYEDDLDKNVSRMQKTFKLWDALSHYTLKGGKSITQSVNDDGVPKVETKSTGDKVNIGGFDISAGTKFPKAYGNKLTALGSQPYDEIETALAFIGKANKLNEKGLPFGGGGSSFISIKKQKQLIDLNAGVDPAKDAMPPVTKAQGGIIPNYYNKGALVNYQPQGTDTVPAMLTPGEFVINRSAAQQNLPLLKAINRGGMQYASSGGVISPSYYNVGGSVSGSGGGYGMSSTVFDNFISSFNRETNNLGSLINNLAKVFPALSGPVSAFGGHINRFERAIDRLSNVEIQGPNIPDTINVNSDTIRVELIAPTDSSYSLSDEDRSQITEQLTNRLRSLTTMGR